MNITEIMTLATWDEKLAELKQADKIEKTPAENRKYYDGEHEILTDPNRQDYSVPIYEIGADGQFVLNKQTGKPIEVDTKTVKRTRTVLNYPVQIVETAVAMVVGKNVDLILTNSEKTPEIEESFKIFKQQWNKAKLDTFNKKMARTLFVETKCAEFMFFEEGDVEKDIKIMLFSKENGDDIWMHYDDNRRADALTRVFTKRSIVAGKADDIEVTQVYTAEKLYEKLGKEKFTEKQNPYKKNTWVYYSQSKPEFDIVKQIIKKQEYVHSQHSDVNVRIGNPPVIIEGNVGKMPDYDSDVKVIRTQPQEDRDGKMISSKVYLLDTKAAPESVKLEMERNDQYIYKFTWPDLHWLLSVAKTGSLSGTAIKLMFTAAEAKIVTKLEVLEDLSPIVSVMKAMLQEAKGGAFYQLEIEVKFNSILPENLTEITDMLSTAVNSKITSKQNAQRQLSYNENPTAINDEIIVETTEEIRGIAVNP